MTLIEFLHARLAEDEQLARTVAHECSDEWEPGHETLGGTVNWTGSGGSGYLLCGPFDADLSWPMRQYVANYDPARVLAEVDAKRRIVEQWAAMTFEVTHWRSVGDEDAAPTATEYAYEQVCRWLASPYADHPDYDPAWEPA